MGLNGWRSKCDYDGKKERGGRSGVGGAHSRLVCFSNENHPPGSLAREGGEGGGGGRG